MRVYLNTSALNRPFDTLSSERVRLEAEAVIALLAAVEDGKLEWLRSEYLDFEVSQDPDRERVQRVSALLRFATKRVEISEAVAARARSLERLGLRGLDALKRSLRRVRPNGPARDNRRSDDPQGRPGRARGPGAARWTG